MFKKDIKLSEITNYKIGGLARFVLFANSPEELVNKMKAWPEVALTNNLEPKRIFILGAGTNILADDAGFKGLVIRYENAGIKELEANRLSVGSGALIKDVNDFLINHSLSGFEWSGGLPGTVGGAIFGNAGAFGGETKDQVIEIESLDVESLQIKKRHLEEGQFSYRSSIFKKELAQKEIILSALFQFRPGNQEEIKQAINEKISYRREHQPLDLPSAGSTFKNVPLNEVPAKWRTKFSDKQKNDPFPIIPAAVFIAEANLKGFAVGGAKVSEKHPNFIVNFNHAASQDVQAVINHVIARVKKEFDVTLTPEIISLSN